MKPYHIMGWLLFGAMALASQSGKTQAGAPVPCDDCLKASIVHSNDIIPPDIFFNFDGEISAPLSSSLLLGGGVSFGTGTSHNTFEQVVIRSTYTQGFTIDRTVGPDFPGVAPWLGPDMVGAGEPIVLTWQPGAVRLGQAGAVGSTATYADALLSLDSTTLTDPAAFRASTFTIQAYFRPTIVPEPNAVVLVGSALGAGWMLRRRRRKQ